MDNTEAQFAPYEYTGPTVILAVPCSVIDAINSKLDAIIADNPDVERDREYLYSMLLGFVNENSYVPDFEVVKR